jgi:pimeloyl-ACP methyl ester carboxylesterase
MDEKSDAASTVAAPEMPTVPGFTHRIIETPGLRIHVAEAGQGEPILMLHGLPQHWWEWRQIGAGLAERYRVICPDLRGFGWTKADSPRIEHMSMRDDMVALLDAMSLDRVRLLAHDMGAVVASHLAYDMPERVSAMVVLSVPPPFMPMSLGMLPAMKHVPKLRFRKAGSSLTYIFDPPYVARPMPAENVATYLAPMQRPEVDDAIREVYRGLIGGEMPRLAFGAYRKRRLTVPTLYVFGDKDKPLTADFVRKQSGDTSRYGDHIEIASVEGAAHFMTEDNPDAVEALARDFFARFG